MTLKSVLCVAFGAASACLALACSSSSISPAAEVPAETPNEKEDSGSPARPDASERDAGKDAGLTGTCADTFGSALTAAFGRLDGVVYAVQKPTDTQCTMPNSDHLIVQVLMGGAVYRMVANVESSFGTDVRVRYAALPHALPAPAFADGWHPGAALDYVTTLGAHTDAFAPLEMAPLVGTVAAELVVGAPVSVYATSGAGRPESAHLIHRNKANADGAIVVNPTSATPRFLLFSFADQTF